MEDPNDIEKKEKWFVLFLDCVKRLNFWFIGGLYEIIVLGFADSSGLAMADHDAYLGTSISFMRYSYLGTRSRYEYLGEVGTSISFMFLEQ